METKSRRFIRLKTLEPDCRCCGRGNEHVCPKCNEMLHNGYAFLIEVKDNSTAQKKKPTGYAVAVLAAKMWEHGGTPDVPMKPGIYFIRVSDLKDFLKDEYNPRPKQFTGRLLHGSPGWKGHYPAGSKRPDDNVGRTAKSPRHAVELREH